MSGLKWKRAALSSCPQVERGALDFTDRSAARTSNEVDRVDAILLVVIRLTAVGNVAVVRGGEFPAPLMRGIAVDVVRHDLMYG